MKKISRILLLLATFFVFTSFVSAKTTTKVTSTSAKTVTAHAAPVQTQQATQNTANQATQMPVEMQIPQAYIDGKVVKVLKDENITTDNGVQPYQQLQVLVNESGTIGKTVTIDYGKDIALRPEQKLQAGDDVILAKTNDTQNPYYIYDKNRLPTVYFMCFIFVLMVIIFAGRKGAFSILGLLMSVLVLVNFIVPNIVAGHSPLLISLIGALMIVLVSLYLSHGFNKRTTLALCATLITLVLAVFAAVFFVQLAHLTGLGSDDSFYLQSGPFQNLNLQGLLLGGIIIGALGVLDDVTTGQTAAVDEIHKANPALGFKELYFRGLSVGHEHIASLVNTLALAYAGASLPLFLIFKVSNDIPFWVNLNSESIIEEVVRTFIGSSALILAVPISTFFAAYFLGKDKSTKPATSSHNHHHHA